MTPWRGQIKICGLTQADEAAACTAYGADAIGMVFYPPSPRNITMDAAKTICRELPAQTARVGVFVNETFDAIMKIAAYCDLTTVQLHGQEPPELAARIQREGVGVIKALFTRSAPFIHEADLYPETTFLVECGKGRLPGGNAMTWNWREARTFGRRYPLVLAGGLSADTIAAAIAEASPDAVDISSGVESSPGRKDIRKVKDFMRAVSACMTERPSVRRIWTPAHYQQNRS